MLTGSRTRNVPIPHEENEWVELKELSGRQLRKARKAKFKEIILDVREMGGEVMKAITDVKVEDLKAAARDPLSEYDIDDLLEAGIVAWSYEAEVNTDTIGELDQKTEKFIAMQLVGAEEEEETKKD